MDECYTRVVEAADGPWPVAAIALIGFYLLVWKFGRDILAVVKATHDKTEHVVESIVTNHGSKNLGDAVDRLTEGQLVQTQILAGIDDRLIKLEERREE